VKAVRDIQQMMSKMIYSQLQISNLMLSSS
jgi:hypothetical protein